MTMMLALTVKEVQSLGNTLTFRLSGNRVHTSPRQGTQRDRKGKGRESAKRRNRRRSTRGCMPEVAVMMCVREGDSERQGERV